MIGVAGSRREPRRPRRLRPLVAVVAVVCTAAGFGFGHGWWDFDDLAVSSASAHRMISHPMSTVTDRENAASLLHEEAIRILEAFVVLATEDSPAGQDARLYLKRLGSRAAKGLRDGAQSENQRVAGNAAKYLEDLSRELR